jgi:hypothetical protein
MSHSKKGTAISLFVSVLLLWTTIVFAGQAATVTHVSGPLAVHKTGGIVKAISIGSKIEEGDTVVTEKRTYARLKFEDGSEVTLKPGTQFKVEKFNYDQGKPKEDSATYNLIKGGLRTITGQVGKRGNQDSYQMKTPTATIGVRGTIYLAEYVPEAEPVLSEYSRIQLASLDSWQISPQTAMTDGAPVGLLPVVYQIPLLLAQNGPSGAGGLAPGLYVQVIDGSINLSNKGGTQNFAAGQFGYTPSNVKPPVIIPNNPGIQFKAPPALSTNAAPQSSSGSAAKPSAADCEVR